MLLSLHIEIDSWAEIATSRIELLQVGALPLTRPIRDGSVLTDLMEGQETAMERIVNLHIERLPEGMCLATSTDIQGLVAHGRMIQETFEIARDVARKLIEVRAEREDSISVLFSEALGIARFGASVLREFLPQDTP